MIDEKQVREAIQSSCAGVDADAIPLDGKLGDYGLDSLDVFNVLIVLQEVTGKEVRDEDVPELGTIERMIGFFSA